MRRLTAAFRWFFRILFGSGLAQLEALEAPAERAEQPARKEPPPRVDREEAVREGALRTLAYLQGEGRLVDFLMEDIAPYTDDQVGAAVRSVHADCRRALERLCDLAPVLDAPEGEEVEVPEGFDPHAIRIVGNVAGQPPLRGVLQHRGWRATRVELPSLLPSQDPSILAPAEVEVRG